MSNSNSNKIIINCAVEKKAFKANESAECAMIASVIAPQLPEQKVDEDRSSIDLVAVIDKSGSMAGEKLQSAKETLLHIVEELHAEDSFSIIAYDTNVTVAFPLKKMNAQSKNEAVQAIKQINSGSATNLCGGLLGAVEQLKNQLLKNAEEASDVKSILLLTDGHANNGITNKRGMIQAVQKELITKDANVNCTINTFGYGSSHNANLLKDISEAFGGIYQFMEDKETVKSAFADCLGGILSVVAQNISVTITANDNVKISKVHTIFPVKCINDKKKYQISIGDIQSEERRDILVNLELDAIDSPMDSQNIIDCKIEYFSTITMMNEDSNNNLSIARPSELSAEQKLQVNIEVDKQKNRMLVADTLQEAIKLADRSQIKEGKALLKAKITQVKSSVSANDPLCKQLLQDLEESEREMKDKISYASRGTYAMNSRCQAHYVQRSCNSSASYKTAYKNSKVKKFSGY